MEDNIAPIVIPTPSRPARIAALHAAGLFLAEHIDLPMPSEVTMTVHEVSWPQLVAVAELHQTTIQYGRGAAAWVDIPVTLETLHGIEIKYTAFCSDVPPTTPMDLPSRAGVVMPEQNTDPWADVMPGESPRCAHRLDGARCVYRPNHGQPHFFDDDLRDTRPGH